MISVTNRTFNVDIMSELSWDKVKRNIAKVNSRLYDVLESIDGIQNMLFTVLDYQYGEIIADEHSFYLPDKCGELSAVPFSMVLEKKLEMFIEFKGKSSTHQIYNEGDFLNVSSLYNVSNTHHPTDILQISSGARNTFLLCPAADARPHASLERYFKVDIPVPDDLGNHYLTFKTLCEAANCNWRSKLLVFPSEIVALIKANKLPTLLSLVMEFDSNQNGYYANLPFYNYLMAYIRANNPEISQNEFTNDAIIQLITIGTGQVPGYGLAVNDDLLPLDFIVETYRDVYKSKYTPFVMEPVHFDKTKNNPVFYSILKEEMTFKPTTFANKPQRCELIYDTYLQYADYIKKLGHFKNTPFFDSATGLEFTLFHEKSNQVTNNLFKLPRENIFDYDPRFLEITNKLGYSVEQFPAKTAFLVGCFGIKYNENKDLVVY